MNKRESSFTLAILRSWSIHLSNWFLTKKLYINDDPKHMNIIHFEDWEITTFYVVILQCPQSISADGAANKPSLVFLLFHSKRWDAACALCDLDTKILIAYHLHHRGPLSRAFKSTNLVMLRQGLLWSLVDDTIFGHMVGTYHPNLLLKVLKIQRPGFGFVSGDTLTCQICEPQLMQLHFLTECEILLEALYFSWFWYCHCTHWYPSCAWKSVHTNVPHISIFN